jgi:hypothetical protein
MTDLLLTQQAAHEYTGSVMHVQIFFQNAPSSAKWISQNVYHGSPIFEDKFLQLIHNFICIAQR